jgi:PleD family two-component response regulator
MDSPGRARALTKLPAVSQLAPESARQPIPMTAEQRILVVDDEPNIVEVVSMALRYQGFEVALRQPGRRRSHECPPSARISSCST